VIAERNSCPNVQAMARVRCVWLRMQQMPRLQTISEENVGEKMRSLFFLRRDALAQILHKLEVIQRNLPGGMPKLCGWGWAGNIRKTP
jgi:hypothetical protein